MRKPDWHVFGTDRLGYGSRVGQGLRPIGWGTEVALAWVWKCCWFGLVVLGDDKRVMLQNCLVVLVENGAWQLGSGFILGRPAGWLALTSAEEADSLATARWI